jgi:hypothetical protein
VAQVADHVVLLAAHRQQAFYLAQLPPQQLVLLPQDLVLSLERLHGGVERLREGLVRTDAPRQFYVLVAVVGMAQEGLFVLTAGRGLRLQQILKRGSDWREGRPWKSGLPDGGRGGLARREG